MVEYNKVNVKLSDTQLNKLKTAVKNKTEKALRMSLKMINWKDLPHELLLTARQKTKLRNEFNNKMSTDLTIIWVGFLGVRFEVEGGGKTTPCLKLVRITLETSHLARKYAPICRFKKYTF